jgi:hypothetical protein
VTNLGGALRFAPSSVSRKPRSTRRWRISSTVCTRQEKASAIRSSVQFGPLASALSSTWARQTFRGDPLSRPAGSGHRRRLAQKTDFSPDPLRYEYGAGWPLGCAQSATEIKGARHRESIHRYRTCPTFVSHWGEMSVLPRARADLATRNSQLAGVAPTKNGARFGATRQQDPTDVTHGRLKDSDLEPCLKRREMALWALEKKRQFSPILLY